MRARPWRNTQGESGGIIIFSEVITDRKQAKDTLQESEESYRVVAETASDCIIKINDESEILFANPVVQDIFGYTPDELLGQPLTVLMSESAHLTRQLLAYAGKRRFLIQPVNLSDIASELRSLIQTSIPRTVHLRLELAKDLPSVEGDPSQLQVTKAQSKCTARREKA
jgi:PAS domain-containing protein